MILAWKRCVGPGDTTHGRDNADEFPACLMCAQVTHMSELNDTYTGVKDGFWRVFVNLQREAPAIFKHEVRCHVLKCSFLRRDTQAFCTYMPPRGCTMSSHLDVQDGGQMRQKYMCRVLCAGRGTVSATHAGVMTPHSGHAHFTPRVWLLAVGNEV